LEHFSFLIVLDFKRFSKYLGAFNHKTLDLQDSQVKNLSEAAQRNLEAKTQYYSDKNIFRNTLAS